MKLEIKYRVWEDDQMYYVLSVDNRDVWEGENNELKGSYSCWYQRGQASDDGWWIYVAPEDVMQYVGVKDRNLVDIYEGDIVDICRHGDEKNIQQIEIKDIRRLPSELFGSNFTWCEVVSNKYKYKK